MKVSVVIPTYNQQERLRLVLCGLEGQTLPPESFEIIVVEDGSTDGTVEMLAQLSMGNLHVLDLGIHQGRNPARNLGIETAQGELVVLLDGDALPAPDLLERYCEAFAQFGEQTVLNGFHYSLADMEHFRNPETGELFGAVTSSVVQEYLTLHRQEMVVTEENVRADFAAVRRRACEGGYPYPESAELQRQILSMQAACPKGAIRWLGFIPHNGAVGRKLLHEADGFDERISFSEGWELAYRLQTHHGADVQPVKADSFHLYHYHDFATPDAVLQETAARYRAIEYMAEKHGDSRIRMLYFWYASLWPDPFIPDEALVGDLVEFDRLYREMPEEIWQEYQMVMDNHPSISPFAEAEVNYEKCI